MSNLTAQHGVVWAAAELVRAFDEPTYAKHLLDTWGITPSDLADDDEADLSILRDAGLLNTAPEADTSGEACDE